MNELRKNGADEVILEMAKYEAISHTSFDPWKAPTESKRPRTEGHTTTTTTTTTIATPAAAAAAMGQPENKLADASVKKVEEMVADGKWVKVTANSRRENSGAYADRPPRHFVMEFIIDGTERSTYDSRTTIIAAGYTHFSGSDRAGWLPFSLPGGKKGQGKEIKDEKTRDEYWAKNGGDPDN